LSAYHEANIELIDQENVTSVNLEYLKRAYDHVRNRLDRTKFRRKMGIGRGDSWPVIMAGYVVNSLNRSADEIRMTPYAPRSGDEYFPTQANDADQA